MATAKTPEQVLGIALRKAASDDPADILAALPDNSQLITDVAAFRKCLEDVLRAHGPNGEVLPKKTLDLVAERLEDLEA